jgi:microcompartment protein CcmL/EutN
VVREALGLVETRGFVAATEAADAMCKTARVRLVRYELTRAARVTVLVRGPVADVEAAVLAGAAAAARLGEVLASHVIPALDPQLERPIAGPGAPRS